MNSALDPLPAAFKTVSNLSITKVITIRKHPIRIGTMIPPSYILENAPSGPSCLGQKPPLLSGFVKLLSAPITKRQIQYPAIIQIRGASHEMALLDFFACTDVVDFTDDFAVGFVSAMTLSFLVS